MTSLTRHLQCFHSSSKFMPFCFKPILHVENPQRVTNTLSLFPFSFNRFCVLIIFSTTFWPKPASQATSSCPPAEKANSSSFNPSPLLSLQNSANEPPLPQILTLVLQCKTQHKFLSTRGPARIESKDCTGSNGITFVHCCLSRVQNGICPKTVYSRCWVGRWRKG